MRVAAFVRGSRVEFDKKDGVTVAGAVQSLNVKTVTVRSDDGQVWRVSPGLLRPSAG